ncbi:DUF6455 family protein [Shimia sp. W99]
MTDRIKTRRHAALLDGAARRAGVDLQEAAIAGALPFEGIGEAMQRCMACDDPDACARWQDSVCGVLPAGADGLPGFCRNRRLMAELGRQGG